MYFMNKCVQAYNLNSVDYAPSTPLTNSAIMSTLTVDCQWEDEMARERIGQSPSYAEAKKVKSLTLHTHVCHSVLAYGNCFWYSLSAMYFMNKCV